MPSSTTHGTIRAYGQRKPRFEARISLPDSITHHIQHHGPHEIKHIFLNHLGPRPNAYPRDCRRHGPPPPHLCRIHAFARRVRQRPAASLHRFVLLRPQLERYLDSTERVRRQFDPNERPGYIPSSPLEWAPHSAIRPVRLRGQLAGIKSLDNEHLRRQ